MNIKFKRNLKIASKDLNSTMFVANPKIDCNV